MHDAITYASNDPRRRDAPPRRTAADARTGDAP